MDLGHYNCRDYYVTPRYTETPVHNDRSQLFRHESFDELEQRARSPASLKPKFPLLKLPLELRQHIFSYLLPRTYDNTDPNPLANHARNFSAVKKRGARGMEIPKPNPIQKGPNHVIWRRGNINLLCASRQVHDECARLMYGDNKFLLFVTYTGIMFRFSWLLPSGLTPNLRRELDQVPKKYLALIRRVIINVDHVDSYTGMIKFNVSGKGLTHGLRKQVQRLVNTFRDAERGVSNVGISELQGRRTAAEEDRCLTHVSIQVSNGNAVLDQIRSGIPRQCEEDVKFNEDVEQMLGPFGDLRGVRDAAITGAISSQFAEALREKMMRADVNIYSITTTTRGIRALEEIKSPPLCVYGNDL